jgi:hypothetical protein
MFKDAEVREVRRGWAFRLSIAFCVAAALFVLNLIRVNLPERSRLAAATPFVAPHNEGKIASEIARIEPGETLPFRANFNHRVTVIGTFRVTNDGPRVAFFIFDEANYRNWQAGEEFTSATATGKVPSGRISRVLNAGIYYFVFDNREGEKDSVLDIDLAAN